MTARVQTVTGTVAPAELGATLIHEHVVTGMPGWDTDSVAPGWRKNEMMQVAKDKVAEMQGAGIKAMVDPCPADLARDLPFCAEISQATGFPIVGATGLYNEELGATPYWRMREMVGGDLVEEMSALFVKELTVGVGDTDVKAGIIKVATGRGAITDYEKSVLGAASKACIETGAPIITHTNDGVLGGEQQAIFAENGVSPNRVIIGHSCGTNDHDYHWGLVEGGTYLGFDRFGLEQINSDENRAKSMLKLIERGAASRLLVSHDTVWCWLGKPFPSNSTWRPSRFSEDVVPMLKAGGASDGHIDQILVENPRRYFSDEPLPALG
ncbi:MAG: phosphotriesterase-related protein [Deltaproteobacteria bacterium]|nr:phosphotriesterase-related protein [Deltaproteobacteria bacterium]